MRFILSLAVAAAAFTGAAMAGAEPRHTVASSPAAPDADRAVSPGSRSEGRGATRAGDIFAIRLAITSGSRSFAYVDRLTPTLRSYTLFAAPLGRVDAELYPFARTRLAGLKDFGFTADYASAFGLSSDDSLGTAVSTTWSLFDVAVHQRVPVGRSWLLGIHGGYGGMTYAFDGALDTPAALPGVDYRFVRGGADARLLLGPFSIYGYGSYLDVLSTGPLGGYFPRASVAGIEGHLGLARDLGYGFEVSLEVAYTRYFYTFNPQPGDPYVAGGALDQVAFGSLGVAYML